MRHHHSHTGIGKHAHALFYNTQEINILSERPFRQDVLVQPEFKTIFAGLSYRFGGGKYRAKSRKQRDDNEKDGGGFM